MKVSIENLGPIKGADLELGDVTIVIGPNASGKSFLSTLFFSLFKNNVPLEIIRRYKKIPEIKQGEININSLITEVEGILSLAFKYSLERTFGTEYKNLITFNEKSSKILFSNDMGEILIEMGEDFRVKVTLNKELHAVINYIEDDKLPIGQIASNVKVKDSIFSISIIYGSQPIDIPLKVDENLLKLLAFDSLIDAFLAQFFHGYFPAVFLPTERNLAISNFIGYLSRSLITKIPNNVDKPSVRLYLNMLLQSMLALRGKKFEIKLGNDEIIYEIKEPFLLEIYNKDGSKIPISLLSSGYSQVIPLDILVKRGRFVIIEEPELNLHAGAQVDIANYLSSLKNKKMFITTHSDIFTIQMAINHVKKKEETLNIYLLNKGTVQKIEYTEKGDVEEIPTITDVIRNQVKEIYGE